MKQQKCSSKRNHQEYANLSCAEREQFEAELARRYTESCFNSALRTGAVNPTGKSDDELACELLKYVLDHLDDIKADGEVKWIIDHTDSLLASARKFKRRGELELALLLYTTWAEHWFNSLIAAFGERKGLDAREVTDMIRATYFQAKMSWVLPILGLPRLQLKHVTTLKRAADLRNGYVHYKWSTSSEASLHQRKTELSELANTFERTVRYLTRYESRHCLCNKQAFTKRLAARLGTGPEADNESVA